MAVIREVAIPEEVLDLVTGRLIRADQVARVRDFLDHGGTYPAEVVAERILDEITAGRSA